MSLGVAPHGAMPERKKNGGSRPHAPLCFFYMVIQLSFQFEPFADAPSAKVVSLPRRSGVDCCAGCEFDGLCDHDECAQKCYPTDMPFAPTLFPNLGVYIDFLKFHGWR